MKNETNLLAAVESILRALEAMAKERELSEEARNELAYARRMLDEVSPGYERPF